MIIPYRGYLAFIPLTGYLLLSGCATSDDIDRAIRIRELEAHLAGVQDDNAMLMTHIAKQQQVIRELELGAQMQAEYIAERLQNCDL